MSINNALPSATNDTWARALRDHRLGYPDVHVVRFLAAGQREAAANGVRRGLDVGFGSGEHLRTLAEFGYEAWGTELLADEVAGQRQAFEPLLRGGRLLHGPLDQLPSLHGRFDAAIAWGVACLQRPSELAYWLGSLRTVMRPGGRGCLNFRTPDNWFHGLGQEIEPHCFALDERAGPYAGATYSFLDEAAVRAAFEDTGWKLENLERNDWSKCNLTERHSWWIVWVRN
jgi:SAM-dependent methyltransferase